MSARAYIALGSNLDEPVWQVRQALVALDELPQTQCLVASTLYRNPPLGPQSQPDYVNAVAAVATDLAPMALLRALQSLEAAAGRHRGAERWGPRPLDLDILLYDQLMLDGPELCLPHPGLTERAFVVYPLAEIAPELSVPGHGPVAVLREGVDGSALVPVGQEP